MRYVLWLTLPALAACSASPRLERVEIPIAVSCIQTAPVEPIRCIPRDQSRVEWLRCELSDCAARRGYQEQLESLVKACQ